MFWKKLKKASKKREKTEEERKVEKMMREDSIGPQFQTAKEEKEHERIKRKAIGNEAYEYDKKFDKQVERNLLGIELEKAGKINEAIRLYEQNVKEEFGGSYPYRRLAIIYRKRGQFGDEIRVLEKAILVYENDGPKLTQFKERLEKAKAIESKKEGES